MENIKIMVVDDEPDFLELMGSTINGWGYDFVRASSGKEALSELRKDKPDIIILDYMMPEMDGIATLKEIRAIDRNLPVIMFTAYPSMKLAKGTEKLGISAFIPKLSTHSDVSSSLKSAVDMLARKIRKKSSGDVTRL